MVARSVAYETAENCNNKQTASSHAASSRFAETTEFAVTVTSGSSDNL